MFWQSGLAIALIAGGAWFYNRNRAPEIPAPRAMPVPNGFDLYVAAARAGVVAAPPVDEVNDPMAPRLSARQRAARYSPARRAAWIGANARMWTLFNRARAAQSRHPNMRNNIMAPMPYGILRELARSKTIEAKDFKARGQWNRAFGSGLDTMEMGHDIERGAPMMGSLVGIAIQAIGAVSVQDVPPHLSAKEAIAGAKRLESLIQNAEKPANVLREEKWSMLTQIRNPKPGGAPPIPALLRGPVARSLATMMDDFAREIPKPSALQQPPPKPTGWLNAFTAILHAIPLRYNFNVARRNATSEQLLLRLALRAYRMENGAYPMNLSQLAPKYLAQIPIDPFGRGESWRYRKNSDSYLAWSIGPDKRDDKGASIPKRRKSKRVVIQDDSVGDWVAKP